MDNKNQQSLAHFSFEKYSKYSTVTDKTNRDCTQFNKKYQQKVIEILNCMVCLGKVLNAHMCPHCSKLSCQSCIKEWLDSKKQECPNCRKNLKPNQLVNCSRFARQIDQTFGLLTKRDQEEQLCKKHRTKLQYYCKTCEMTICSDCAMIATDVNLYHILAQKSLIRQINQCNQSSAIKSQASSKYVIFKKALVLKQFDRIINANKTNQYTEKLKNHLNLKIFQLRIFYYSQLSDRIEKMHQGMMSKQQFHLNTLQSEWNSLKNIYDVINTKVNSYSKVKLIEQEQNILGIINSQFSIKTENNQLLYLLDSETIIENQLVPNYNKKTFLIPEYSALRKKKQIYYTDKFISNNLQWRLKIYPNGNQNSEDNYISIFVQLYNGFQEVGKYKYKVEIINQKNKSLKISREFESQFQIGECWGYNTYSKISTLYDQGYVHPQQDFLQIVLHIKSPSYYHLVLDQNKVIENKKKLIQQNRKRIKQLKERIKEKKELQKFSGSDKKSSSELIKLDQICEITLNSQNLQSPPPFIEDSQIFGKVIKCDSTDNKRKIQRFNIRSLVIKQEK